MLNFSSRDEIKKNERCSELMLDQENAGSEEILIAARKIMVEKKVQIHCLFSYPRKKLNDKAFLALRQRCDNLQ